MDHLDDHRLPSNQVERDQVVAIVGEDGLKLLTGLFGDDAPVEHPRRLGPRNLATGLAAGLCTDRNWRPLPHDRRWASTSHAVHQLAAGMRLPIVILGYSRFCFSSKRCHPRAPEDFCILFPLPRHNS